jgi:glycosyltransferase involved in cell wall biosynthesis
MDQRASFAPLADVAGSLPKLPLVTIAIVNWNYAAYVGAAIDSIRAQDYPAIEALIVDNGSSDDSLSVIEHHVAGDPRFTVVRLGENLGLLGAFLETFERIRGRFVVVLDADDVLMPGFLSAHIQVHLALSHSVAFTSSNVIEIAADGDVLSGSFAWFGADGMAAGPGLRPADSAFRLPNVTEADYGRLAAATARLPSSAEGWFWGLGSSNVYRRDALDIARPQGMPRAYFRSIDHCFNILGHALGGSALIDLPLSLYRLHGANEFSERASIPGWRHGRRAIMDRNRDQHRDTIAHLLRRADYFCWVLRNGRFWNAIDRLAPPVPEREAFFDDEASLRLFAEHHAALREIFGAAELRRELRRRMSRTAVRRIFTLAGDEASG